MNVHKEPKAENSAKTQASVKYFAKCRNKWDGEVARGAGFERLVEPVLCGTW